MINLSLAPDGSLRLTLPTGRTLDVVASPAGLRCIQEVLRNAASYDREHERRGHIREFPTQHVINAWMRADQQRQRAEAEARTAETASTIGVDLDKLDISL